MSLGWVPIPETIELHRGDWIFERTRELGLPPSTTAAVHWANGVTWPATVDGGTVSWHVLAEDCTAAIIPDGTPFEIHIIYPNEAAGTAQRLPWFVGSAYRTETLPN